MFSLFSRKRRRSEGGSQEASTSASQVGSVDRPQDEAAAAAAAAAVAAGAVESPDADESIDSPLFVEDSFEVVKEVSLVGDDIVEDSIEDAANSQQAASPHTNPEMNSPQVSSPQVNSPQVSSPPRRAPGTPRRFKAPADRPSPASSPQRRQKAGFLEPSHHPAQQRPYKRPRFRSSSTSSTAQPPSGRPVPRSKQARRFANSSDELDLDEGAAGVSISDGPSDTSSIAERIASMSTPHKSLTSSTRSPDHSDQPGQNHETDANDSHLGDGSESVIPDSQPTNTADHAARLDHHDAVPVDSVLNTTSEALINLSPPSMLTAGTQEPSRSLSLEKMVHWLQQKEGRRAYVLSDFLEKRCGCVVDPQMILESVTLAEALSTYIVSHDSQVEAPVQMQGRHKDLASDARENPEGFFRQLSYEMRMRQKNTQVELEIIYGPWADLANAVGRLSVVFILLYNNVYKPVGEAQWLQISGELPISQSRFTTPTSEQSFVTKRDIVFREFHNNGPQTLKLPPLTFSMRRLFPSSLQEMIETVEARARPMRFLFKLIKVNTAGWTPRDKVAKFLLLCIKKIFPRGILGSAANDKALGQTIRRFVNMSATANMPLGQAAHGIKLKDIPWTRQIPMQKKTGETLLLFWEWLFDHFLKPMLSHHFYMTEMSGAAASLYYYELSVWARKVRAAGTNAFINQHGGDELLDSGREGERLRFIPKRSGGVRPIVNLKEFNQSLQYAHAVLQSLPRSTTRLESWHNWYMALEDFKVQHPLSQGQKYYVVKLDISGCYDNVDKPKLEQVVREHLSNGEKEFWLQTFSVLDTRSGLIKDRPSAIQASELFAATASNESLLPIRQHRNPGQQELIYFSKAKGNLQFEATRLPPEKRMLHGLPYSGEDVLSDLRRLLHEIKIQVKPSDVIAFDAGIPQGSSCSLDLCNLILDHFVHYRLTEFLNDPRCTLLRYVDDFLFVTTDKELAHKYQDIMLSDFGRDYGVSIKEEKQQSNLQEGRSRRMEYLGYEFNPDTLDLYPRQLNLLASAAPVPIDKTAQIRRLHFSLESLLGILRAYQRAGKEAPYALQKKVSREFGKFVADSSEACKALVHESDLKKVIQKMVYTKLLAVISPEHRRSMQRAALKMFNIRNDRSLAAGRKKQDE